MRQINVRSHYRNTKTKGVVPVVRHTRGIENSNSKPQTIPRNVAQNISRSEQNKFYEDYIIKSIDSEPYEKSINTPKEKLQFLRDTFRSEYGHMINRVGEQRAFSEWLSGLPSAMDIPFYNDDIIKLAKKSGSLPQNATPKQEQRVLDNYWNFMSNKTFQLFRKYDIK